MPLQLACPFCNNQVTIPDALRGKSCNCPICKRQFRVTEPAPVPPRSRPAGGGARVNRDALEVSCPHCQGPVSVPHSLLGQPVLCPTCQQQMMVPATEQAAPSYPVSQPASIFPEPNPASLPGPSRRRSRPSSSRRGKEADPDDLGDDEPLDGGGDFGFRGTMTPKVGLLANEEILDSYAATALELGILAWLFGSQAKLVLTTHRLFLFTKGFAVTIVGSGMIFIPFPFYYNQLESYWLPCVKGARVGKTINLFMLLTAVMVGLTGVFLALSIVGIFGALVLFLIAALLFFFAFRQTLLFSVNGGIFIGLQLNRVRPDDSARFINKLFHQLHWYENKA
jgi:hypothetical protein